MNRDEHRGKVDKDDAPASPVTGDLTGSDRMLDRGEAEAPARGERSDTPRPRAPAPHPPDKIG